MLSEKPAETLERLKDSSKALQALQKTFPTDSRKPVHKNMELSLWDDNEHSSALRQAQSSQHLPPREEGSVKASLLLPPCSNFFEDVKLATLGALLRGLAMGQYFTKTLIRDFPPKGILGMLHR